MNEELQIGCDQCGQLLAVEQGAIAEESGQWLCAMCLAEEESCGCSDEEG